MPYLPPSVSFPVPGEFVRYWDVTARRTKYIQLADIRAPLVYPRRLASVASGATTSKIILNDLRPSRRLSHRYMAYIGFHPGAFFRIHHPSDQEQLNFDERPADITVDLTRKLTYRESPYDRPTYSIWIEPDRVPAIEAINVMERTSIPEIVLVIAKYRVKEEPDKDVLADNTIDQATLAELAAGRIPSMPISFGGDV